MLEELSEVDDEEGEEMTYWTDNVVGVAQRTDDWGKLGDVGISCHLLY